MTLSDKQSIFSRNLAKLLIFITDKYKVSIGEVWRTSYMQEWYIKNGMSKTMKSGHLQKLAADLNIFIDNKTPTYDKVKLKPFGDYWKSLDSKNIWGGDFTTIDDAGHFEMKE